MLQIINGLQIASDNYYYTHKSNGMDELHFSVQLSDPAYPALREEEKLRETTTRQTYTVKQIRSGSKDADIDCQLDLSAFSARVLPQYSSGQKTAAALITPLLPTGWTLDATADTGKKRSVEMDCPTPLEVLLQMQKTFRCALRFDNRTKTVRLVYPDQIALSNAYVVDSVNLRRPPSYKGKTTELYTRLYAYGKDDMGIASVNGGKAYVDAQDPCTADIICAYWKDSRYTDAQSLRDDAQERVNAAARAEQSWDLDVIDLQRIDADKWPDMALPIFTAFRLIDHDRATSVIVQVMEADVYPYYPEKNRISASTVTQSVQRTVKAIYKELNNYNSEFYQMLKNL